MPSAFPYTEGKYWDGGVYSLINSDNYSAWPVNPSLAYGLLGEINAVFLDDSFLLRLGRFRRDWSAQPNGNALFINAYSRPFCGLDVVYSPLKWLDCSVLFGALEYYRDNEQQPHSDMPFQSFLSVLQLDIDPLSYLHLGIGGSVIAGNSVNMAVNTNLELRLPGFFNIWGSLFVDNLYKVDENFYVTNGNNYAFQTGIKALVRWLPFASLTMRYTKIEPYCYTNEYNGNDGQWNYLAYSSVNGGESLGYCLPPNSDEFMLRFETMFLSGLDAHLQLQMIRHGTDFGYGAVGGSSLRDKLVNFESAKYFLMDGVYRWDNVIKLGASVKLDRGAVPLSIFAEAGYVGTRFTINGAAGVGNEADYDELSDSVYRPHDGFIFSLRFKLF